MFVAMYWMFSATLTLVFLNKFIFTHFIDFKNETRF